MKLGRFSPFIIVLLVFGIGLFLITSPGPRLFEEHYECYYSGAIGSTFAALFAAILVCVAWAELGKLSRTSSADFIYRLNTDFFKKETRILLTLVDLHLLVFIKPTDANSQPYFNVNPETLKTIYMPEPLKKPLMKEYYSIEEIDDYLLGHLENIGILEHKGIISFKMVYDVFSWYITRVWDNNDIKQYIQYNRDTDRVEDVENAIYSRFQYIALKCLEYEDLHAGPCRWFWNFKRFFCAPKISMKIETDQKQESDGPR